jgi:hypothetical protein
VSDRQLRQQQAETVARAAAQRAETERVAADHRATLAAFYAAERAARSQT